MYNYIVIAVVANKMDLFQNAEVEDYEGRYFARTINAIFQRTSAKEEVGLERLLEKISYKLGEKYFKIPPYNEFLYEEDIENMKKSIIQKQNQKQKEENNKKRNKKCNIF